MASGPFRWTEKAVVELQEWSSSAEQDLLDATCTYAGFTHRRRILFAKPSALVIVDTVEGPPGDHTVEQFWHLAFPEDAARFSFSTPAETVESWRSRAFASREPVPALRVTVHGRLSLTTAAVVDLSDAPQVKTVTLEGGIVTWGGARFDAR